MKKNPKQMLLTFFVTIGLLVPVIIKIVHAFNIKLSTFDLVETVAELVFLILSYGIGAAISGVIFSKIHVKKYIACVGSLVLVILCAIILPPVFIAIMNRLFSALGIIGLAIAFIIAILFSYLSTAGVFLLSALTFNKNFDITEKIIGTLWIQKMFKDKKGA